MSVMNTVVLITSRRVAPSRRNQPSPLDRAWVNWAATPPLMRDGAGSGDDPSPLPAPSLISGGVAAQLTQALSNGEGWLRREGATLRDVIKTTVFITDMDDYAAVNEAYSAFFGDHRPARSVIAVVALPMGALVEAELWAYTPS